MHPAISLDPDTATTRFQTEAVAQSYLELLQATDFEVKHCAVKTAAPMAEISWTTADVMRRVSPLAFAMEAYRRGLKLVGVENILSGAYYESGKKKHVRQKRKGN
jgi:hypothetical protein